MANEITRKRIWELDFLRGVAIFLMILDHFTWDIAHIDTFFKHSPNIQIFEHFIYFCKAFQSSDIRFVLHIIFVFVFFLLVGISSFFSKSNLKRGLRILIFCLILDIISYLAYYIASIDIRMIFNVLFPIGVGILLLALLKKIKYHRIILLVVGLSMVIIGFIFNLYHPKFDSEFKIQNLLLYLVGVRAYGSDCFALIPYIGIIFLGYVIGETFYKEKRTRFEKLDKKFNRPFCFIGRHTLVIYLLHQVILAILILILGLILGYRF